MLLTTDLSHQVEEQVSVSFPELLVWVYLGSEQQHYPCHLTTSTALASDSQQRSDCDTKKQRENNTEPEVVVINSQQYIQQNLIGMK